jgi:hypothetical protein
MALVPKISLDNNIHIIQNDIALTCSILLGKNYLTYCISDENYKTVFHLKHFYFDNKVVGKNDFDEILADPNIKKAKRINVAIDSFKTILVPNELLDEKEMPTYFRYLHDLMKDEMVMKQTFNSSIHDLYVVKKSTIQFLESRLKNVHFYNASACLLTNYPDFIINENQHSFFISMKDENAVVTLYQKSNLVLHQVYAYTDVLDIVYHVANICKQHSINIDHLGVQFHGEIAAVEGLQQSLKKYFPLVRFTTRVKDIQYPDTLYAQPAHYFFNLFSIFKCAL